MLNKHDFLNAIDQNIDMVRGDTLAFNFSVKGLDGVEPNITFTCREHYDGDVLFNCESSHGIEQVDYDEENDITTFAVWVDPVKTKYLDLARYYYDLELSIGDDVLTLMRGRLTLLYDVTKGV